MKHPKNPEKQQQRLKLLKEAQQKEQEFKDQRKQHLQKMKDHPNKFVRFWRIVWHYASFPFIWIWRNVKDWRTFLIFLLVCIVLSCEVWIPYLLAVILGMDTEAGKWLIGVGSACWTFWLLPATPFLPLCIVITIFIKSLFNKFRFRKLEKYEEEQQSVTRD